MIDKNGDGYIDMSELKTALDVCGFKLPGWQVRQMIEEYDDKRKTQHQGRLSFEEFEKLCSDLKAKEVGSTFKKVVSKKENLETLGGMSDASSEGTTHSVRLEEQLAFSDWINSNLGGDADLAHLLPLDAEGKALYDKVKDGILLCKIINHSCPDTIDERAINKKNLTLYTKHENLTLALNSAQAIGCNIVNIDARDLANGTPHLVLGLLWQIIRIGLFNQITLENCPGLTTLLNDGEHIEDLMKLSPEAILLRWVNHHLERAGVHRYIFEAPLWNLINGISPVYLWRCNNFQSDIQDSEIYTYLMKQIAPADSGVTMSALMEPNHLNRAELMLQEAAKLGCRSFVTPNDVVNGIYKLNLAFVANLFNNHPGLDQTDNNFEGLEHFEETREEKKICIIMGKDLIRIGDGCELYSHSCCFILSLMHSIFNACISFIQFGTIFQRYLFANMNEVNIPQNYNVEHLSNYTLKFRLGLFCCVPGPIVLFDFSAGSFSGINLVFI
ncbi:hypothetical protein J437_LFUL012341 [Ladona fulva]|uniref:Plastin-2 n=1 Tax=Ladona fulva TaxID=123851 RepID=A0A8K0P923_LADFU|nr:hypothetical protein J437_LFUL012341 [Ladona fulva]